MDGGAGHLADASHIVRMRTAMVQDASFGFHIVAVERGAIQREWRREEERLEILY